jgi:hypothetical protein
MMPIDECYCCGGRLAWNWSEAFDKFGFNDGDCQVETEQVCDVLQNAGYAVETVGWGLHNTIIRSIIKDGRELMPSEVSGSVVGYDDPRTYLPADVVALLDEKLPDAY